MAQIHIMTGPERRRPWSDEQKRTIVAAAFAPGAVVAEVARHADVHPSLIYRWRRGAMPREGAVVRSETAGPALPGAPRVASSALEFVPIGVVGQA